MPAPEPEGEAMAKRRFPEVFGLAAELAASRGAKSIKDLAGCFEMQIDDRWWCAFNGHREPTECTHGTKVTPYGIYFEFNGWPAGIVDASGGELVAGKEDDLIEAIQSALRPESGA